MLEKSVRSDADAVAYDLEDSVAIGKKDEARARLVYFLNRDDRPTSEVIVRINSIGSGFEEEDLRAVLQTKHIQGIALPKANDVSHVAQVVAAINKYAAESKRSGGSDPLRLIGMIESAEAMVKLRDIASHGHGHLDALLFAAEDYCADIGIRSSGGLSTLAYARSRLVTMAKAYGLQPLDLVCVDYKDQKTLEVQCDDGNSLGFEGKQAIHPNQVATIQAAFSPSQAEVDFALRVQSAWHESEQAGKGAFGLDGKMIDMPVLKQAMRILSKARL